MASPATRHTKLGWHRGRSSGRPNWQSSGGGGWEESEKERHRAMTFFGITHCCWKRVTLPGLADEVHAVL